jgi:hypothetical protein
MGPKLKGTTTQHKKVTKDNSSVFSNEYFDLAQTGPNFFVQAQKSFSTIGPSDSTIMSIAPYSLAVIL